MSVRDVVDQGGWREPAWSYAAGKRLVDLIVAALVLVGLAPLWALVALAIRLTSPGPVLFRGTAIGRGGQPFTYYKFRTMRHGTDDAAHRAFLARYVRDGAAYAEVSLPDGTRRAVYKLVDDPRVTTVGRWLRRCSLDEVPQLWNVLRGEMSLVGPRPPVPAEYEHYAPHHRRRLDVPPGITGLYQVTARSTVPFEEMVRIDLEYVRRRSLALDLAILARTVLVMLTGRGAY